MARGARTPKRQGHAHGGPGRRCAFAVRIITPRLRLAGGPRNAENPARHCCRRGFDDVARRLTVNVSYCESRCPEYGSLGRRQGLSRLALLSQPRRKILNADPVVRLRREPRLHELGEPALRRATIRAVGLVVASGLVGGGSSPSKVVTATASAVGYGIGRPKRATAAWPSGALGSARAAQSSRPAARKRTPRSQQTAPRGRAVR
jgi:hypothetical protein